MEFKELIAVFQKQGAFFFGVVFFVLASAFLWQSNQRPVYEATLLLNIGREGVQSTTEYTYDSFYRLQADERFADTVVRWLTTPRVVEDIYTDANLREKITSGGNLKRVFNAGRLSSQVIEVSYSGESEKSLVQLTTSVTKVLNRYTENLNKENKETSWFVVIGSDPVIRDARIGLNLALAVSLVVGLFVAFWAVLLRHYFSK